MLSAGALDSKAIEEGFCFVVLPATGCRNETIAYAYIGCSIISLSMLCYAMLCFMSQSNTKRYPIIRLCLQPFNCKLPCVLPTPSIPVARKTM